MKSRFAGILALLVLVGCAPYKYLKPEPEVSSEEAGYKDLGRGDKHFVLKNGKRYVISFPPAESENFYLVLKSGDIQSLGTYFTDKYEGKNGKGAKIDDESPDPEKMRVYPIDPKGSEYYWLIDKVESKKLELVIEYRYVPKWRFKFENKYEEYTSILKNNRKDRTVYESINEQSDLAKLDSKKVVESLNGSLEALEKVHNELLAIDSIFPKNILNSSDEAVQNYKKLKQQLEDEIAFQKAYKATADYFGKTNRNQNTVDKVVGYSPSILAFYKKSDSYTSGVLAKARSVLASRFEEFGPYIESLVTKKTDQAPFDENFVTTLHQIDTISALSKVPLPENYTTIKNFVFAFNDASKAIHTGEKTLDELAKKVASLKGMPNNTFYEPIAKAARPVYENAPKPLADRFSSCSAYRCTQEIDARIKEFAPKAEKAAKMYYQASELVPQVNHLTSQKQFREALRLLKQNAQLTFLLDQYKELDRYSLNAQAEMIQSILSEKQWRRGEELIAELHHDQDFIDMAAIAPQKNQMVEKMLDVLVGEIVKTSAQRSRSFMENSISALGNIDSLYQDSSFLPVHVINPSIAGNPEGIRQRQIKLANSLAQLRDVEFPEKAIKTLYKELTASPSDNGVYKARAVVEHGKHYKGKDKKIMNRVHECNPWIAKWVTKPKTYRRVFAIPISTNKGMNTYVLKLNFRIPSEAKFPVYDLNVKLPKTVADKASSAQWYEHIKVNDEVIKNEGRYSITSPGAANDYECQITAIRMLKDKNNVLEIRFKHPSFTLLPVSIMAQKPIIKKN